MRIFLDTCTFQLIYDYGSYVFENDRSAIDEGIQRHPNGVRNIEALHDMFQLNAAGSSSFSFVLSSSSLKEIRDREESGYTRYAYDLIDTWNVAVAELGDEAFSGDGRQWCERIQESQFEYLSAEDREVIADALLMECDCFLTVEEKLPKHADHLNRKLPIELLRPFEFWEMKLVSHLKNYPL